MYNTRGVVVLIWRHLRLHVRAEGEVEGEMSGVDI